jgi:hypothetical protein
MKSDNKEWLEGLKPGDPVAVIDYRFGSISDIRYARVAKVTPTGIIVIDNGVQFRSDGTKRETRDNQNAGHQTYIDQITEETEKWRRKRKALMTCRTTTFESMPLEALEKIAAIIKESRLP